MINFFIIAFALIFMNIAHADVSRPLTRGVIYCPDKVTCKNTTCTWDGINKDYFQPGIFSFQEGVYYFSKSEIDNQYHTITCLFQAKSPFENEVLLVIKRGSNLDSLLENWTKWEQKLNSQICESGTANMCPLIERQELMLDTRVRDTKGVEETLDIDVSTEDGIKIPLISWSERTIGLNYEKTLFACKNNKKCKLFIRVHESRDQPPYATYYIGGITVSVDEITRVVSITQLNSNAPYLMKIIYPMNNTITFYKK